jgi:hypothetical protein
VLRRSLSVLVILSVSTVAGARFSAPVQIKTAPQAQGRYFDPHNHWNGVLPYRLYGGISETGRREIDALLRSPQGDELKRLLPASDDEQARARIHEYLAHHVISRAQAGGGRAVVQKNELREYPPLFKILDELEARLMRLLWQELQAGRDSLSSSAERMAAGTQTLRQFIDCPAPDDPKLVKHLLQSVLTANPQNDFDAAYVARSLIKIPSLRLQLQATLDELAYQQIGYVEMSQPITRFIPTSADRKSPPAGFLADEMTSALLESEATGGPQLRWLPMLLTGMLADDGRGRSLVLGKESGQCESAGPDPAPMLKPLLPDSDGKSLLERVLAEPMVIGFDMASPERSCFTQKGAEHFATALHIAFAVAQAQHKRLVAHVHVGEGFPVYASASAGISCENPKAPRQMQPLQIKYQGNQPLHFINAENNIEMLLNSVEMFRDRLRGGVAKFDDHVEVRFAHVTHATLRQAKRMRQLHIVADVNLTSNLATGALTLHGADVWDGFDITSYRPLAPGDLKRLSENPDNARLFKSHSLIKLLIAGVPVVLGTDGGGVEHSTMVTEYALAEAIINAAWEGFGEDRLESLLYDDAKHEPTKRLSPAELLWMKQAISLKKLYENQHEHYRFISAAPGTAPRWPSPRPAQKIWKRLSPP